MEPEAEVNGYKDGDVIEKPSYTLEITAFEDSRGAASYAAEHLADWNKSFDDDDEREAYILKQYGRFKDKLEEEAGYYGAADDKKKPSGCSALLVCAAFLALLIFGIR